MTPATHAAVLTDADTWSRIRMWPSHAVTGGPFAISLVSLLVVSATPTGAAADRSPAGEYRRLWYSRIQGENLALNKPVRFATKPDYWTTLKGGTDGKDLTDGRICGGDGESEVLMFHPQAVGWFKSATHGINLLIDLGAVRSVEKVVIRVYGGARMPNQILPSRLEALVSVNGTHFYRTAALTKLMPGEKDQADWEHSYYVPEQGEPFSYPFELTVKTEARFVGLRLTGHSDFVFSDEVAVIAGADSPKDDLYTEDNRTPFFLSGLVFRPQKNVMYISTNINTPHFFIASDLRGGSSGEAVKAANDTRWVIEMPREVELISCPWGTPIVEATEEDGRPRSRFVFGRQPSGRSAFYFQVAKGKALPEDAYAVFYGLASDCEPNRVRVPVNPLVIPEVPRLEALHTSLAWTMIDEQMSYPGFFKAWRHLGFNTVSTFPRYWTEPGPGYWHGQVTEDRKAFLREARSLGFKVLHNESPFRPLHGKRTRYPEVLSRLPDGKTGDMCPSYRGRYYGEEVQRIGECFEMTNADFVFYDIELWYNGVREAANCLRCQEACAKSGKAMDAFLYEQGTEMFRHYKEEIQKRCAAMGRESMPVIGSYNHHAVHPTHHGIIDFWQAYPRYIDQAQPSLYVRGSALAVHESIKGNYQLTKSKNILPWLTTGCYGEFASEKIEPMIYEALLNGSAGITYYAFQHFDTPLDFYYHAKALATIARYQAFIVKALPYAIDPGHTALTPSALVDRDKKRLMILLGNYGSPRDITTTITLPFESTASVRDLLQGKELNTNNNQVGVTIKGGGFVLLWADTGRP